MPDGKRIYLSFGSNLGDRAANLERAIAALPEAGVRVLRRSSLYETEPVSCPPNSPKFLNAALEIEYEGVPKTLLKKVLAYEVAHDRNRDLPKNAARTIDIDILYFGEVEILDKDFVVPHPRIAERRFVLLPLSTIRSDMIVKGTGKTVRTLLRELPARDGEIKFVQQDW